MSMSFAYVDAVHISNDGNSVNMTADDRKNYHHGDLRAALVQAGLGLLEERQSDDIGLREVARTVGVSATAVYRHFPDKAALLRALAAEGLTRLAKAQQIGFDEAGGGKAGFIATGRAYVRFALDNPALFRLIFSNPPEQDLLADAPDRAPEAFRMLRENAASVSTRKDSDSVTLVALDAWAKVHGLAILMLDGQIPRDEQLIDALIAS
jgi:AcrR family transcriptional regulator